MDWGLLAKVSIIAGIAIAFLALARWLAKKTLALDKWLDSQRLLRKQKRRIIEGEPFTGRLNKFFNKKKNTILNEALRASEKYKYEEAISKFRSLLTLFTEPIERIAILNQIGLNQMNMSNFKGAKDTFNKMADEAEKNNLSKALSIALGNAGIAARELGELKDSIDLHSRAFKIAEELGYNTGEGKQYGNMATAYLVTGNHEMALELYGKSLKVSQDTGDYRGISTALCGIGLIYRTVGEPEQALEFLETAYEIAKRHKDKEMQAIVLNNLGVMYKEQVKDQVVIPPNEVVILNRAMGYFEKVLKVSKKIRNLGVQTSALINIGNIYRLQKKFQEAFNAFTLALDNSREIGARLVEAEALGSFGNYYSILGKYDEALKYHKQSLQIYQETGYREGEGKTLGNIGLMYFLQKNFKESRTQLLEAKKYLRKWGLNTMRQMLIEIFNCLIWWRSERLSLQALLILYQACRTDTLVCP